jgi:hypothetical protein
MMNRQPERVHTVRDCVSQDSKKRAFCTERALTELWRMMGAKNAQPPPLQSARCAIDDDNDLNCGRRAGQPEELSEP